MFNDHVIRKHVCELSPEEKKICNQYLRLRRRQGERAINGRWRQRWTPILMIDHQEFRLELEHEHGETDKDREKEATWFAEQLAKALARLVRRSADVGGH